MKNNENKGYEYIPVNDTNIHLGNGLWIQGKLLPEGDGYIFGEKAEEKMKKFNERATAKFTVKPISDDDKKIFLDTSEELGKEIDKMVHKQAKLHENCYWIIDILVDTYKQRNDLVLASKINCVNLNYKNDREFLKININEFMNICKSALEELEDDEHRENCILKYSGFERNELKED